MTYYCCNKNLRNDFLKTVSDIDDRIDNGILFQISRPALVCLVLCLALDAKYANSSASQL